MNYVHNFSWPHGQKQIVARHTKGGLINAIVESWYVFISTNMPQPVRLR